MHRSKKIRVGIHCSVQDCDCEGSTVLYGEKDGNWGEINVCEVVYVGITEDDTYVTISETAHALGLTLEEFKKRYVSIYPEKGYHRP